MQGLDRILAQPGAWMAPGGGSSIVVSSRVRLARNLDGRPFPGWAGEKEIARVWAELSSVLEGMDLLAQPMVISMGELNPVEKEILKERHLISTELAARGAGSGVVLREDESVALMINEEDHIRAQAMCPGMHLAELWKRIDAIDSALEERVQYAFSPKLGYLTACPTNIGTGLRASVMLHLPGLRFLNEIDPVIRGLNKIGLAVRGLLGEGTEASGNMYQVSNQSTLGETEIAVIERMTQIADEIIEHERNARLRLLEGRETLVRDRIGRAFGILSQAHILTSRESLDLLSALRLGVEVGMVRNLELSEANRLMLATQPGHLQWAESRPLTPEDRDTVRATVVRAAVGRATLVDRPAGAAGAAG